MGDTLMLEVKSVAGASLRELLAEASARLAREVEAGGGAAVRVAREHAVSAAQYLEPELLDAPGTAPPGGVEWLVFDDTLPARDALAVVSAHEVVVGVLEGFRVDLAHGRAALILHRLRGAGFTIERQRIVEEPAHDGVPL